MSNESIQNKYTKIKSYTKPTEASNPTPSSTPSGNQPAGIQTNVFSILGLVFGLLGGLLGIIFSSIALAQVKKEPKKYNSASKGMAIAGLVVSLLGFVLTLLIIIGAAMPK